MRNDYAFLKAAIEHLKKVLKIQVAFYGDEQRIDLTAPEDLQRRFRYMPKEIWPENGEFVLCTDRDVIQNEIRQSRKEKKAWPRIHYLWPLNPVVEWVNDKLQAAFGRHEAPVLNLKSALTPGEIVYVISGLIPNRKSHPLVHRWIGVTFQDGKFAAIEGFKQLMERTGLDRERFPNPGKIEDGNELKELLPTAIEKTIQWMSEERKAFEEKINKKLNDQLGALERLRNKQYTQLEFRFMESRLSEKMVKGIKDKERRRIDRLFAEYLDWVEDTMTTEDNPYIQVIAVLKGID